jgi:hypothetical protein
MANWHNAVEHRTGLLWPDRVHPRPAGARLYARVVAAAVQATRPVTALTHATPPGQPARWAGLAGPAGPGRVRQ